MTFETDLGERLRRLEFHDRPQDRFYEKTYPIILKYFNAHISPKFIDEHSAKTGVLLVYSWMGRAVPGSASMDGYPTFRRALLSCAEADLGVDRLTVIQEFVGGSLIAASKFLHFYSPDSFAMWDSHVAYAAYRFGRHRCTKLESYLDYLRDLSELTLPVGVKKKVKKKLGAVTSLRMKEFALFQLGIAEQRVKNGAR